MGSSLKIQAGEHWGREHWGRVSKFKFRVVVSVAGPFASTADRRSIPANAAGVGPRGKCLVRQSPEPSHDTKHRADQYAMGAPCRHSNLPVGLAQAIFELPGSAGAFTPAPPRTRTCRFPAYGSSSDGYAKPWAHCKHFGYWLLDLCVPSSVPAYHPSPGQLPSLLPGSGGFRSPAF